ncbi:MAG: hypothetical protein ABJB47_00355 [Actinomycetota bacterium]
MVSHGGMVRDAAESQLPRLVGVVAVILPGALLIQVLASPGTFRYPAVAVAIWLGVLAAAGWLLPRASAGGGLSAGQGWLSIGVALAAIIAIGWDRRVQSPAGTVDWSILGTVWLIALVALSRPARVWVTGALAVFVAHAYFVVHVLGTSPLSRARLSAAGYIIVVILTVFAALRPTLHAHAAIAARRAALASQSAAERAASAAVRLDRTGRLALLEMEALPLLRGIASGALDPAACDVRDRCARHAATLRRALVDRAVDQGGLLAGLEPALEVARARGLLLEIQLIGDPGTPSREVMDATVAAVDVVIRALPPHPVSLTVLASDDEVELYVTFAGPPQARPESSADLSGLPPLAGLEGMPGAAWPPDLAGLRQGVPAAAGWDAGVETDPSGSGCLEIRWQKAAVPSGHGRRRPASERPADQRPQREEDVS